MSTNENRKGGTVTLVAVGGVVTAMLYKMFKKRLTEKVTLKKDLQSDNKPSKGSVGRLSGRLKSKCPEVGALLAS